MCGIVILVGVHHGNGRLQQAIGNGVFEQYHPVIADFIQAGLTDKFAKIFLASEDGIFETSVYKCVTVSFEAFVDNLENADTLFRRNILHIGLKHFLADRTFHFREGDRGEILVCRCLKTVGCRPDACFVLAFQG